MEAEANVEWNYKFLLKYTECQAVMKKDFSCSWIIYFHNFLFAVHLNKRGHLAFVTKLNYTKTKSNIISSDALELKFGEPSRAELEIFRAEPSRAGCLWKASWIRAGFFSKTLSINVTAIFFNSIFSFISKKFSKGKAILWKLLLHKINNNYFAT